MPSRLRLFEVVARRAHQFTQSKPQAERDEHPFDQRNIDPALQAKVRALFDDGHYTEATSKALVFLDNEVKRHAKAKGKTTNAGFKLMMEAFSETKPLVQLTKLEENSEIDEQEGYKLIFAGSMKGIRNPRAHEHKIKDSPDFCLDVLSLISLLLRRMAESGFK